MQHLAAYGWIYGKGGLDQAKNRRGDGLRKPYEHYHPVIDTF
jgi:hypothetical protein